MDLHERYLHFPTLDFSVLQTANSQTKEDVSVRLHLLIKHYNQEMTREILNVSKLEICRMLWCYKYQLTFTDVDKRYINKLDVKDEIHFSSVQAIFPVLYSRNTEEISILCDIIVLQMILCCDTNSIERYFKDFFDLYDVYTIDSEMRYMYIKILEHLLDYLRLHWFLRDTMSGDGEELEGFCSMYLKIITLWLEDEPKWELFLSMLSKLTSTFPSVCILFPLWNYVLSIHIKDFKKSLTALSVMADVCFAVSSISMEPTSVYHHIFSYDTFWLIILQGLRSPMQQYRKQALYLLRTATDYMNKVCPQNSILTRAPITPFICDQPEDLPFPMIRIKEKFFLVYEALEEKSYHLVMPALTHVTALMKASKKHEFSDNCFDIVWLQCILERILQHEDNRVIRWGMSYVCELDEIVLNNHFLELFINTLNNTFLYECRLEEDCSEVVNKLSALLKRAEEKGTDLLNRFLKGISEINWGPIAMFYVIHAIRMIACENTQRSTWKIVELNAVKTLVERNLSVHAHVLRMASQIELLTAIPDYVQEITLTDLTVLADVLTTFSSNKSLERGKLSWNALAAWLQKILKREDAVAFVENTCAKYLDESNEHDINPRMFALMVLLLYDANLILHCSQCNARKALHHWLYSLDNISARSYADPLVSINVAEFISHLMNSSTDIYDDVSHLISVHVHNTFLFLVNLKKINVELTYDNYVKLANIVLLHIAKAHLFMSKKVKSNYAEILQNESIKLLKDLQRCRDARYLYGLRILYLSQDVLFLSQARNFYVKDLLNDNDFMRTCPIHIDADAINLKGKIASEYYLLLTKLMFQYLANSLHSLEIPITTLLFNLLEFLELGGLEIIPEVAKILALMINNQIVREESDQEILKRIFLLCQKWILEVNKKNSIYWTAVENLTEVVINDNFFLHFSNMQLVEDFIDQLMERGNIVPKLKRILLSKTAELNKHNLRKISKSLFNCLFHVLLLRRDKKVENQAHLFIVKHLGQYYPRHVLKLDYSNDTAIRVLVIIQLNNIVSDLNYMKQFVSFVLEMLEKYKNKRYFNDSHIHKLKHRLMQSLLLIEPMLKTELNILLQEILYDLIFSESNQHSVRLMQEWLMVRLVFKSICQQDKLNEIPFVKNIKKETECTVSMATIIYHVVRLLAELSESPQESFIRATLPYIVQGCLSQQFNVRLYNQFILIKLYNYMEKLNSSMSIIEYKGVYKAAEANLQLESSAKHLTKMQDDFYFSHFHPVNDYSLQTIYLELPRLTNVSCDEWISPDVFRAFSGKSTHLWRFMPFFNSNLSLSNIKTSIYLEKTSEDHTQLRVSNIETYLEGLHDIQRKINPLKSIVAMRDYIFESMKESIYLQNLHGSHLKLPEEGLIVVASFVSRLPNLGGITRTCEIFGVKTLIIANLDYIKNKEFQCLSVSAERWITILQVKPHELQKYLLEKKVKGWSLVGAEQTANSRNLLEMKFKSKTILILGNEKDGIPANLIPLLDTCVEIHQVGVTRSLNVHVTAAICIWQYASQHTLESTTLPLSS